MDCPVCGGPTGAFDSIADCEAVYRRRKCKACEYIFYTTELELPSSMDDFGKAKYSYWKRKRLEKREVSA